MRKIDNKKIFIYKEKSSFFFLRSSSYTLFLILPFFVNIESHFSLFTHEYPTYSWPYENHMWPHLSNQLWGQKDFCTLYQNLYLIFFGQKWYILSSDDFQWPQRSTSHRLYWSLRLGQINIHAKNQVPGSLHLAIILGQLLKCINFLKIVPELAHRRMARASQCHPYKPQGMNNILQVDWKHMSPQEVNLQVTIYEPLFNKK